MLRSERVYTSDMTGQQWENVRPLLSPEREGPGRPPDLDLRQVVNAIFYVSRAGCQWKNLPKDYQGLPQSQQRLLLLRQVARRRHLATGQ